MNRAKVIYLLSFLFFTFNAQANYLSWQEISKKFQEKKLNGKALSHIQCFFEKYGDTVFQKKISYEAQLGDRCGGSSEITIDAKRYFALVDYTASSNDRRMFIVDRETGTISSMGAAHGRYNASMINTRLSKNKNSVKYARYFSNEIGSNAPSSGFFVTGGEYEGKFGRSMTLHGLESGINDNACERAVVVHKHSMVTNGAAYILSSGCVMISKNYLNGVIDTLKAEETQDSGVDKNGAVLFIYGQRELGWKSATCDGNFNI